MSGDNPEWAALLRFAHELADVADRLTLPAFGRPHDSLAKADGSVVSQVDLDVERELRERIARAHPNHAIRGEEFGDHLPDAEYAWHIDPIDGTQNFLRGVPAWATLVCVEAAGQPAVAVVSAPALQARWDGQVGVGARRDGRAIHVAATRTLAEATISFGGLGWFAPHGGARLIDRLTAATARQRGFGDFWHHCLVAEGAVDVALEGDVAPWDLAAVRCIVRAAGGAFADFAGDDRIDGGTAISTIPGLLPAVLDVVQAD